MCDFINDTHVMPGLLCCQCRTYNGLQRTFCKFCGAQTCEVELPEGVVRCAGCGFGYEETEKVVKCPACGKLQPEREGTTSELIGTMADFIK